jgi:hyperosmotically inducible periplasmic protein
MKRRHSVILTLILSLIGCATMANEKENEQTSDAWLKAKIVTTYALSEHLNPFSIDVDVIGGVVTLTGTVENDIERDLAGEIAKGADGVKKVNNNLNISADAQRNTERGSFMRYVEDANITARVKSRLLLDPNTHGLKMHVTTKNSVVILEGKVKSDIEADLARQIVLNTKGVVDIQDNLVISKE